MNWMLEELNKQTIKRKRTTKKWIKNTNKTDYLNISEESEKTNNSNKVWIN